MIAMEAIRHRHPAMELYDQQSATDNIDDASDDDRAKKSQPKVTKNSAGDGFGNGSGASCGTNNGKNKKRKLN